MERFTRDLQGKRVSEESDRLQVCWERSNLAARLRPADGDMATEAVPPEVSPWDAPLTPSYPPALSPGTKRATGRSETGGDSYSDAPGPLLAGKWMLKRSEHLKRWNKRWVSLDATGARLTFRVSPGDAKALSHVPLEDLRGASVSSVNFHGNKSYAGRCVLLETKHADPESDASRAVFLVAETPADASRWVADVRALVPPPVLREHTDGLHDDARLSPAAAPPTPALVAAVPRRSAFVSSETSAATSSSASDAGTPMSDTSSSFVVASGGSKGSGGSGGSDTSARSSHRESHVTSSSAATGSSSRGASRWRLDFAKTNAKSKAPSATLALAAEELQATRSATHAQMAQMQEMTRAALEAKDASLRATQESVAGTKAAAAEASRRADVTQARLDEKSAEAASLRRELEDVKAAAALASDLARARLARADALERELGVRLATAEARGDAMADARDAAEAAGKQTADALRADLEAAGVSALRAATEAEASLDAARRRIEALEFKNLELERLRGWKGVFGGAKALSTSSKKSRDDENETLSVANRTRDDENRNDAPLLARRNSAFESLSARRGRGSSSSSSSSVPRAYRRGGGGDSGGGFVAAATAAAAAAEASTPEAAATARRRLFEYGLIAPPTPADVIHNLDSPGAHGCKQM
jgi:hypothetical protein